MILLILTMGNSAANLTKLYLQSNRLTKIENTTFQGLEQLHTLYLYSNSISYIQSEAFKDLKKLVILDLSQNILSQIDFTFAMMDIPGTVEGHYLLEVLWLGGNHIRTIQDNAFKGLGNLQQLQLDGNVITSLQPGTFRGLTRLSHIKLQQNLISTMEADVLAELPRPLKLDITHNPLRCDQSLCWLQREINNGTIEISTYYFWLDQTPDCESGQDWSSVMSDCVWNE